MIRLARGKYFGVLSAAYEVAGLNISVNTYLPHERVPRHAHTHSYLCLVLAGGFTEQSNRRFAECRTGSVIWHPEGEEHADRFCEDGGMCLGVGLSESWSGRYGTQGCLPDQWTHARGGAPTWIAQRLARELQQDDDVRALAVEGLTCALLAEMNRAMAPTMSRRPPWLQPALDRLHDEFRAPPSVGAIAADAGVHRSTFSRVFHQHLGCTMGEYVRRLRIDWACQAIKRREAPSLALLALLAGFADQAHFARTFKRLTGQTPAAFRQMCAT